MYMYIYKNRFWYIGNDRRYGAASLRNERTSDQGMIHFQYQVLYIDLQDVL